MKYVYGPVPSRRLGRSLGVDPIPSKTCNFSCVYCQLGRTNNFINERRDFFSKEDIFREIKQRINLIGMDKIDYVTFVGNGEPTLCQSLGWLIEKIKEEFQVHIALITNGALLYIKDVREELHLADVVLPTLDAGFPKTFKKINRPHPSIQFNTMIEGMIEFRRGYRGQIWLEYMAVKDFNDSNSELQQIHYHIKKINPDRIYINVPIRPPAEKWVQIPSEEKLSQIREILTGAYEIILPEIGDFQILSDDIKTLKNELIQTVKRHPMRLEQLLELLEQKKVEKPLEFISKLEKTKLLKRMLYKKKFKQPFS
ncbi:MAG: radical SAM protein [Promethearchaeota archaeon]